MAEPVAAAARRALPPFRLGQKQVYLYVTLLSFTLQIHSVDTRISGSFFRQEGNELFTKLTPHLLLPIQSGPRNHLPPPS